VILLSKTLPFFFNEADTLMVIRLDEDSAVDGNLESRATVIFWISAEKQP